MIPNLKNSLYYITKKTYSVCKSRANIYIDLDLYTFIVKETWFLTSRYKKRVNYASFNYVLILSINIYTTLIIHLVLLNETYIRD